MLDLPELLKKVFQRLDRHDLTQCAQVNKQWHALTIPHIWSDLTCVCSNDARRETFRRIVLEDYLQENGHEEEPPQPSALSNYGHLVRLLPSPVDLESTLRSQASTQQCDGPTTHDLLFYLFKRLSKARIESFRYELKDPEPDEMKSLLAYTLPRLRSLYIEWLQRGTLSELIKFKSILNQCATTLESLDVDINILHADDLLDMEDEAMEDESICWTSLKDLTLRHNTDAWDTGTLWSWMWKRCSQVERLHVRKIDQSTPSLVQAMSAYMHNLQEIIIGDYIFVEWDWTMDDEMKDDIVAALISGSSRGWKSVSVRSTAVLGRETMKALALHYSTLEELNVDGYYGLVISDVVQALRSCPHLHTLSYTDMANGSSVVYGKAFIDLDPDTGLFKPWLCEGSLKVLEVMIAGIPRADLEMKSIVREAYPGQGREIQSQVYDRLGRLTNLKSLKLGDHFGAFQCDCLEMSLESGLDKLSGLKALEELNIESLATKIGTQEVQWMVENWPNLCTIYGLDGRGGDVEAVEWLQENRPKIVVAEGMSRRLNGTVPR
ncbi:MAG: hypothetical protein J3Q66DRAFT_404459 [Benniella sp.]|nr:MAG: hypothetical protein J3Q66DRAFT_404459 [Benniella sp.]